jgi:hypothetical protein
VKTSPSIPFASNVVRTVEPQPRCFFLLLVALRTRVGLSSLYVGKDRNLDDLVSETDLYINVLLVTSNVDRRVAFSCRQLVIDGVRGLVN